MVGLYARVSSAGQKERHTIEQQRQLLERYCQKNNIQGATEYFDDGVSSTTTPFDKRPQGSRLIRDAADGKIKTLYLCDWDRLARRNDDYHGTLAFLERDLGMVVESITQPFDASSPDGRFYRAMAGAEAERESMRIRIRTTRGKYAVASQDSKYLGGPRSFGYRIEGRLDTARYVLDEIEAPIANEIYIRADRGETCMVIARWLDQTKVPTVKGGRWWPARVLHLLRNPMYKGFHTHGRRGATPVTRTVPAIVDPALWDRVQAQLSRNQLFSKRNAKYEYLLAGLMRCRLCGLTYVGNGRPANKALVYRCNGRNSSRLLHHERCPSAQIRADASEDMVTGMVENFLRQPRDLLKELKAKLELDHTSATDPKRRTRLEAELKRKAEARVTLALREAEGLIDRDTLADGLERLDQDITALRSQLSEIDAYQKNATEQRERLTSAAALLNRLRTTLDAPLTFKVKRQLLELLVEKIEVETVGVGTKRSAKLHISFRFIVNAGL